MFLLNNVSWRSFPMIDVKPHPSNKCVVLYTALHLFSSYPIYVYFFQLFPYLMLQQIPFHMFLCTVVSM